MLENEDAPVSNASWLELLHSEVCWLLRLRGVDVLVIKGPTIEGWLYLEGDRESADVDLLVRPEQMLAAITSLVDSGFEQTNSGTRPGEVGGDHSYDFWRTDPKLGQHGIDVHRFFPGIEIGPAEAFAVLWERRAAALQAGTKVWYPDYTSRALIIALHAARDPLSAKTSEDLRRAMATLSQAQRQDLATLAAELRAQAALKAGLGTRDDMIDMINELGLSEIVVPVEWQLKSGGADRTATRLNELSDLPWMQRPGRVARWLFPTPALMQIRDPRAGDGTWPLARAYSVRLGQGIASLPASVRALRAARRQSRSNQ